MWPLQHTSRRLVAAWLIAMAAFWSLALAAEAFSQGHLGVASVAITVEPLAPAVVRVGLTKEGVTREVERLLRSHDVAVNGTVSDAQLTVTINAVEIKTSSGVTSGLAYTVAVSLDQEAIVHGHTQTMRVTTWRHAGIGVASLVKARGAVRGQLVEYLEAFASDHE
jgi:hypothetical protein